MNQDESRWIKMNQAARQNSMILQQVDFDSTAEIPIFLWITWTRVLKEWGEGGEAKLRRLPDGSFDLLTSAKRGGASSGYGTSLNSLSDGARLGLLDAWLVFLVFLTSWIRGGSTTTESFVFFLFLLIAFERTQNMVIVFIISAHQLRMFVLQSLTSSCPRRDVCALSMLFVLPGFISGMQDASLPFIVLDEPEACQGPPDSIECHNWCIFVTVFVSCQINI